MYLDLRDRAGGEIGVARDGEAADRIAWRDNAAPRHGGRADRAVATQRAARIHRDVGDDRTVDRQRTAVHRRRAGVAAVAGEVQRTAAGLGEAAVALD